MYKIPIFLLLSIFATQSLAQSQISELQMRKLQQAEYFISHGYVDDVNEEELVDAAIKGMLAQLDPHSTYIRAKDVERTNESLNGSFEGIGIQFQMIDDTLVVVQPVSGGPCEKQGIIAGDRIVTVNDTAIAGVEMSRDEIMTRLRGPKGSKVRIGVIRQGIKGINIFTIIRDKIPVYTIDAAYMVDKTVGYIRISSFGSTTYDEFMSKIKELKEKGMARLIIDLQSNGGGYMQPAVKLGNEFLEKDEMIVSQKGNNGIMQITQAYKAEGNGTLKDIPVVVLVDSYSASSSEILTGAIQDNDRGLVVGRRTFGKGLVQKPVELVDGSMIRLTTSHYYTPSGRCIQKPYEKGNSKSYDNDIESRLNSGELTNIDSIHFEDSLKFHTTHLKRTVYGGGGIMPDYYVPLDTTQYTKLHRELSAKGCINNTVMRYLDQNRYKLQEKYNSLDKYKKKFNVNEEIYKILMAEAEKSKIEVDDQLLEDSKPMIGNVLKALIARDLFENEAYYEISNTTSTIFQKGLEVINSNAPVEIKNH